MSVTVRVVKDTGGAGVRALAERLKAAARARVLVGVPAGKQEPDGMSMAHVAAITEFGGTVKEHERASRETRFSEHAFRTKEGFASYRFAKKDAKSVIIGRRSRAYTQGSYEISERPFLRPGVRASLKLVSRLARRGLREVAGGREPATAMLDRMGLAAAGSVKRYMVGANFKPNAPSTVKKKGSSQPTVDSGALRQGVTHVVEGA